MANASLNFWMAHSKWQCLGPYFLKPYSFQTNDPYMHSSNSTLEHSIPKLALIDSGATKSFIFPDLMDHFSIPTYTLSKSRTIWNIDGTENKSGKVTEAANLDIHYQGKKTTHTFFVINLENNHTLLRMPFLTATNPNIDWTQGTFKGKVIAASMNAHKWKPNQNSKVFKPFVIQPSQGYRHYECSNNPLHFINIDPDDYIQYPILIPTHSHTFDALPSQQHLSQIQLIKLHTPGSNWFL